MHGDAERHRASRTRTSFLLVIVTVSVLRYPETLK
jgi:hypothetical protein